jgi:hypothetical protein
MLQIEASDVGAPKKVEIRFLFSGTIPPQPQLFRLSAPLATRQSLYLYQHKRPDHYGQRPPAAPPFM